MALAMHTAFKGQGILRTVVLVPWAVLTVVTAITWRTIFEPELGLREQPARRGRVAGRHRLAGRGAVRDDGDDLRRRLEDGAVHGAADPGRAAGDPGRDLRGGKVDGATAWQRFSKITLPLLKPAILVALIFRTLDALRIFDLPFVLTKGANGTNTLSLIAYEKFSQNRLIRPGLGAGRSSRSSS